MELIDQLEPIKRGIYGGACGYLSYAGDMDVAIAIRTGIIKNETLYVQAAAGVVADSVPELEWAETEAKARALLRAAVGHRVRIMFPMVATADEVAMLRSQLERVQRELAGAGATAPVDLPIGLMGGKPTHRVNGTTLAPSQALSQCRTQNPTTNTPHPHTSTLTSRPGNIGSIPRGYDSALPYCCCHPASNQNNDVNQPPSIERNAVFASARQPSKYDVTRGTRSPGTSVVPIAYQSLMTDGTAMASTTARTPLTTIPPCTCLLSFPSSSLFSVLPASNSRLLLSLPHRSLPIIVPDTSISVVRVDIMVARRPTKKNPFATGGNSASAMRGYAITGCSSGGSTARAYSPTVDVIISKIIQNT
mgnify:CR=1 FL=1